VKFKEEMVVVGGGSRPFKWDELGEKRIKKREKVIERFKRAEGTRGGNMP